MHFFMDNKKLNKFEKKSNEDFEHRVRYTPALLWGKPSREVDLKYSLARVSMELIADYPPGIPILLPGEVIKKEHIEYLKDRQKIKVLI